MSPQSSEEKDVNLFTGHDYFLWRFQMKAYLIELDLWDAVEGDAHNAIGTLKPEDVNTKSIIMKQEQKAFSKLVRKLGKTPLAQVIECETSHRIWNKLDSIYGTIDDFGKIMLKKDYNNTTMSDGDTIDKYVESLTLKRSQLKSAGLLIPDGDHMTQIMSGLPESYLPLIAGIHGSGASLNIDLLVNKLKTF